MYYADWRKAESYTYTRTHTNRLWAWEFLRRNPEYYAFWEETLKEYLETVRAQEATGRRENTITDSLITISQNAPATEQSPNFHIINLKALGQWGTAIIFNPRIDCPWYFSPIQEIQIFRWGNGTPPYTEIFLEPDEVAIKINLLKPISTQLDIYRKVLLEEQKNNLLAKRFEDSIKKHLRGKNGLVQIKRRGTTWQDYLRVLDADAEGYKSAKAAAIIFPKKENQLEHYRSCLKRARKIMEGDYRKWL